MRHDTLVEPCVMPYTCLRSVVEPQYRSIACAERAANDRLVHTDVAMAMPLLERAAVYVLVSHAPWYVTAAAQQAANSAAPAEERKRTAYPPDLSGSAAHAIHLTPSPWSRVDACTGRR